MKNIVSYDKYEVKEGNVKITEYGYCPGCSVTDNPEDICRIVDVSMDFLKTNEVQDALENAKQYVQDCTERQYMQRLEELKLHSVIKSLKDLKSDGFPDGSYISITD